jgi:hypothetical protein
LALPAQVAPPVEPFGQSRKFLRRQPDDVRLDLFELCHAFRLALTKPHVQANVTITMGYEFAQGHHFGHGLLVLSDFHLFAAGHPPEQPSEPRFRFPHGHRFHRSTINRHSAELQARIGFSTFQI